MAVVWIIWLGDINTLLAHYSYHQFLIILSINTDFRNSMSLTVISYSIEASLPNISLPRNQYIVIFVNSICIYMVKIYVWSKFISNIIWMIVKFYMLNRNTFIFWNWMRFFRSYMVFYSYWHLEDLINYVVWSR